MLFVNIHISLSNPIKKQRVLNEINLIKSVFYSTQNKAISTTFPNFSF